MAVLEVTKRRLNPGIFQTNQSLLKVLPTLRTSAKTEFLFYAAIEDPTALLILSIWPSISAHTAFSTNPQAKSILTPLDNLSTQEWTEHIDLGTKKLSDLPTFAPIMTISRAFLKPFPNPQEYFSKISSLKVPIEEETKPWSCVFDWTVDTDITTEPGPHKWLMFVGWRTKKQHRLYSQGLRETLPMFSTIPAHYDEGTEHFHCWDLEKERGEGWAEVNMIA